MNTKSGWIYGIIGWLIPGAGHLMQKRFKRGLLMGAAVLTMFFAGQLLGGDLHSVTDSSNGLLSQFFGLFNLGAGLPYLFSWLSGIGFANPANVQRVTFEYGNVYLMVAGLLNYLLVLDAYDIGAGRKQ